MTPSTLDETRVGARRVAAPGTLALSGGVVVLPPAVVFSAIQAQERHPGYRHLLLPQARFARPRGLGALTPDEGVRLAPGGRPVLRVAPPGRSLADLAADAALDLRDQLGSAQLARTTHVIVASCALNEGIGDSVVGRMQYELGLQRVTPFALGQNGTLGWYSALTLLEGLLNEGDQALVILSDKWLYPFFRQFGDLVGYGDAAAALLVSCAGPAPEPAAWGGVRAVAVEFGPSIADPWADAPGALRDTLAPVAARAIRRALDMAGLRTTDIDWCVPPGFDPGFAARVADAASIPLAARVQHEASGHLSSAESAAALIRLAGALDEGERRTVLVWDAALHGAAGAAVVDLTGGFDAALDIEGEA
ncbi:hypothetical protein CH72_6623 [Burkholderia ambifaria AMMD]|uniref:3-oxoacyl-[acyl-carrier-protein] synthase n=1 Tax=Burkholderia ambifaria (strain ATCC BAA-244 / DSM 16087 / CCUG 44356 / LMG 19182 / AMMD) TaxID=339670 RepID=Q0B2E2_BURCM|nr:hypothetical protein [Burkholderia ambifaria]ABI91681.1 conserved hypothetical protein [Burkholderia ambifaria AMMD]AJY26151.1 hypothetical protein CH72_6623 [Burkholderia ambifaria AMMD]MBR7933421.1 hypothetical protein [Burkholderia ambifaria]PEH70438.1 hypothetical protein CRM91_03975 [Burkholderia ambifaria]QQC08381.1 hypothetical protein I6H84_31375 [Burkholderia ambifaria]